MSQAPFTGEEIASALAEVKAASAANDTDLVRTRLEPLLRAQAAQREAAAMLLKIAESNLLTPDLCLEVYERVEAAHPDDDDILIQIGEQFSKSIDIDFLNAPRLV